ncbi:MarR family transcriptional regulator [Nocardia africana]|uniref:MarR family transcriptional regulator n=1 Tax=Nocardia africana TaxID=134964 RepID=A0ABW6NQL7_9NOCA
MTPSECDVLRTLAPGGLLTTSQLQRATAHTTRSVRHALARLHARGLIVPSRDRCRWQLSPRGRAVAATIR